MGSTAGASAKERPSPEVPRQEILDAAFPKSSLPSLVISLTRPDGGSVDPICGLAPAELKASRGDRSRVFNLLIKAPDSDPLRPAQAFFRFRRLTVDADGSARAYHPEDPLGVGSVSRVTRSKPVPSTNYPMREYVCSTALI
jgi:hypothetical protein